MHQLLPTTPSAHQSLKFSTANLYVTLMPTARNMEKSAARTSIIPSHVLTELLTVQMMLIEGLIHVQHMEASLALQTSGDRVIADIFNKSLLKLKNGTNSMGINSNGLFLKLYFSL